MAAGAESQGVELIFISHDGKTAEILGNAFAEDLGFTNVYVLEGGIQSWIKSNRKKVIVDIILFIVFKMKLIALSTCCGM